MKPEPVASKRHTLVLLGIFTVVAALTALQAGKAHAGASGGHVPLYLGAIAFEWLLFWGTLRGLKAHGTPVRALLGDDLAQPRTWLRGIGLGLVAWPFVLLVGTATKRALAHAGLDVDAETARTVARIGPHGVVECALWLAVSLSAGICEEFVFRGYLLRQFAAWFGWPLGLVLHAIVFGLGHAYQGLGPTLTIVVHGVSFGLVAIVTRRLLPGMTAHALEDAVAGLSGAR